MNPGQEPRAPANGMTNHPQDTTPPRPVALPPIPEHIPDRIKQVPHWVGWRWEWRPGKRGKPSKYTKVPYQVNGRKASSTNSKTWDTFEAVWAQYQRGGWDGIGYVVTPRDGVLGVDIDYCVEDGALTRYAQDTVARFGVHAEYSPSGHGIRLLPEGTLDGLEGRKTGPNEIYSGGRFVSITGHLVDGLARPILNRQAVVAEWHAEVIAKPRDERPRLAPVTSITLDDQELLTTARAARNGPKFTRLYDQGDVSAYGGDESAADLALANELAFYSQDHSQLVRLMESSALRRDKWYDRRGAGTWLDLTIAKALADVRETYRGARRRPSAPPPPTVEVPPEGSDAIMAELVRLRAERDAALRRADEAEAQNRALLKLMSHPQLRNEVRLIVAEAAEYLSALRRGAVDEQGLAWLYIGPKEGEGLAGKAGRAPRTISRQLQRHAEYLIDEQPLVELHEDEVEGSDGHHRTRYRFKVPFLEQGGTVPQLLEKLATYTPVTAEGAPRATPGGNRGHCPSCGGALERESTIKRRTQEIESYQETCTACGVIHAEGEQVLSDETHILRYRRMRLDLPGDTVEETETSAAMMAEVVAGTDAAPDTGTPAVEDHYRATSCPVLDVEPSAAMMAAVPGAAAPHGLRLPPGCTHWCAGAHQFPVPLPAKVDRCTRCTRPWRPPGEAP